MWTLRITIPQVSCATCSGELQTRLGVHSAKPNIDLNLGQIVSVRVVCLPPQTCRCAPAPTMGANGRLPILSHGVAALTSPKVSLRPSTDWAFFGTRPAMMPLVVMLPPLMLDFTLCTWRETALRGGSCGLCGQACWLSRNHLLRPAENSFGDDSYSLCGKERKQHIGAQRANFADVKYVQQATPQTHCHNGEWIESP